MDFRNPISGSHPWASYQQQRPSETPASFGNQFNPAVPGFNPNGMETQRYQQYPPTPPGSNVAAPGDVIHMRNYVLSSHFSYTKDITGLQRESQKNSDEIEGIKDVARRDMQTLQSEIEGLREHVAVNRYHERSLNQRSKTQRGLGQVSEDFSKESIADVYLEEAETLEATAMKLREQAAQLSGRDTTRKLVRMKMIEGPKDNANQTQPKAEFACCGHTYGSVKELLEHVQLSHGSVVEQSAAVQDTSIETTPTHVPPRRPRPSEATGIKQAESIEEQKLKAEIAEIREELVKKELVKQVDDKKDALKVDRAVAVAATADAAKDWVPFAVRQMRTIPPLNIENNTETFTWEFLKLTFRGEQWSPGFYFISKNSALPSKSYWVLEAEYEPYLPKAPGQHGAKLTAFFNGTESASGASPDETNYLNVPVFICPEGKKEYVYFGNFSQTRFSDRLDYDHVAGRVPTKIRRYWAEQLAELGRPEWVTQELIDHFWPKPTYCGPIPTNSAVATPVTTATPVTNLSEVLEKRVVTAIHEYAEELKEWNKETEMKVRHLTADNLMEAFERPDSDEEPGLRLWWEYMEFVGYDQEFYDFLVGMKYMKKPQNGTPARTTSGRRAKPVQQTSDAETVVPASPTKLKPSNHAASVPTWKTGAKSNTNSVKPWAQTSNAATTASSAVGGDLEAAKAFQAGVEKNFAPGARRDVDGKKVPPHMRHGR